MLIRTKDYDELTISLREMIAERKLWIANRTDSASKPHIMGHSSLKKSNLKFDLLKYERQLEALEMCLQNVAGNKRKGFTF